MSLLQRRRMMMQTTESGAKYPLVNGRHEFNNGGYVEVTNGNHIILDSINGWSWINISNIYQNTTMNDIENINNKSEWFSLNTGDICILKIYNMVNKPGSNIAFNFRRAESSTSSVFGTGVSSTNDDRIVEKTIESEESIGCLFLQVQSQGSGVNRKIEFDVEFTVNGERWI